MLKCSDTQMFTTSVARPGQVFKCSNYYIFPSGDGDWTADLLKCPHRSLYLCYRNLAQVFLIYKKIIINFPFNCYQSTTSAIKNARKKTTGIMKIHQKNNRRNNKIMKQQQQEPASSDWAPDVARPGLRSFQPVLSRSLLWAQWYFICSYWWYFFSSDKDKSTN